MTLPTKNETTLIPWEPFICPGCGWQHATSDGYCLDCTPSAMGGEDEWDDDGICTCHESDCCFCAKGGR